MAHNHPVLEGRLTTVGAARDDASPRLAKGEKMATPELKAPCVEKPEGRARKKLILFVEIDGRAMDAVAVITRCRSSEQAGAAQGRWKMAGVLLDPETGKATPLVVKERREGKVEELQPQRDDKGPSIDSSVTFPVELAFTVDETVLPFPSHLGQRLPLPVEESTECYERVLPERREGRNGRPTSSPFGGTFSSGDVFIDFDKYEVAVAGRTVDLPHMTMKLLFFLVRHPGRVHTREHLLDQVWGWNVYISPRNVDLHISRIRKAIEKDPTRPVFVLSVLGVGYKFNDSGP